MSLRTKQRLAFAVLAAYLCWGPVHRWLVARYDLNPWKFGGMAMYATAAPRIGIGFYRDVEGRLEPLEIRGRPSDHPLFLEYYQARRHAGQWARPDALAEWIFAHTDADAIAIVVTRRMLDPETDRIVGGRRGYRYRRGGPEVPTEP